VIGVLAAEPGRPLVDNVALSPADSSADPACAGGRLRV